jgi:hypothetical protein
MRNLSGALLVILVLSFSAARAERRKDPFNQVEIDQLRDAAQEPDIRLKLYVKFARARLDLVEKVGSDPKETDKPQATHDRLQDFLDVYDELNDNVDTYADRKNDIRKSLKSVIEADNEFQAKLRALKDAANTSPEQAKPYEFLLSNALDAVDSSVGDHRQLLTEQEDLAKHKKLVKPDTLQAN